LVEGAQALIRSPAAHAARNDRSSDFPWTHLL
jgi:hypothetical protein